MNLRNRSRSLRPFRWGLLLFVAVLFVIGLAACGGDGEAPEGNANNGGEANDATSLVAEGEEAVQDSCISCHGDDLTGASGPAIDNAAAEFSEEELYDIIENGTGSMPGGTAEGQEEAVVEYLMSLE